MKDYNLNIDDILIHETALNHNIDLIITTVKDWERAGIKSLII